jgi:hypothetical protein
MDHRDFRILDLAGSPRRASVHRGLLRAEHEVKPEWMSCDRSRSQVPSLARAALCMLKVNKP